MGRTVWLCTSAVTLTCVGAMLTGTALAHPPPAGCAPQGAAIYAKSRTTEVYELAVQPVFGCVAGTRRRVRRVQLGSGEDCAPEPGHCPQGVVPGGARPIISCRSAADLGCGLIASVGLAGSVVAYDEYRNEGSRQEVHMMSVRSLRNGRMLHRFMLGTDEDVQEIVLTRAGATAWVEFNREPGCFSFGHDGNRCYGTFSIYAVGTSGFHPLALNLAAEPTLSLAGARLTWTAGSESSSTPLT
jgi:hypothetical protein